MKWSEDDAYLKLVGCGGGGAQAHFTTFNLVFILHVYFLKRQLADRW